MARKKKILVVSDSVTAPTGFGRVADSVLSRLHETGEWEIHQMGINFFDEPHDKPYRIYMPSAKNKTDWLGVSRIKEMYEAIQPDVVWLFQDFWHVANYIKHSPNMRGLCVYFPVDSPNIKSQWAIYLSSAVKVASYTEFAAKETAKSLRNALSDIVRTATKQGKDSLDKVKLHAQDGQGIILPISRLKYLTDPKNIHVLMHGVDKTIFYPVEKSVARDKFGFAHDWFIVGNVNRNQSRKRLDLSIRGFAEFAKDRPNVRLLFHDPVPNPGEGWDLVQLAVERYGIGDKLLLNHGGDGSENKLSLEDLNLMYNSVDVMINTGGGEGFGLCSAESACCKIPQIVPNWSATAEIWKDSGILLDVISVRHEPHINTEQCVIDTDHLARELAKLYESPQLVLDMGKACYETMLAPQYDWDLISEGFIKMFNEAYLQKFVDSGESLSLEELSSFLD